MTVPQISSLDTLKDAYVRAGGTCSEWVVRKIEETGQGGLCDSVYFVWFLSGDDISRDLGERLGNFYDGPALVGPNWIVYSERAEQLKASMGGSVRGPLIYADGG